MIAIKTRWHKAKKDLSNLPDHTHWLIVYTDTHEVYIGNMINPTHFRLKNGHNFIEKKRIVRFCYLDKVREKLKPKK
jgi:hypothetical protein